MIRHQYKYGNHEYVSVQTQYSQIQPTDLRMDKQDLHYWGNLFRNGEAEIQTILQPIMTTLKGLYGNQEE